MKKIPVLIDVDTGIDDATALVIALASDRLDIRGVTAVCGNATLENTTRNTLNVLDLLGRGDIPVAAGAASPLARPLATATYVHGASGLRGYEFARNATAALRKQPAWDLMREVLEGADEKITIIALGPLTNIAQLMRSASNVKEKIEKIIFMGASYHCGNPGPVQTFNVLVDPEAFREVIFSGVPFYAVPLDTTRKSYLIKEEKDRLKTMRGPAAELLQKILFSYGAAYQAEGEAADDSIPAETGNKEREGGKTCLHDPTTMAFAVAPELFHFTKYYCDVECKGELTTGWTLIDKDDWYCKEEHEKNLFFVDEVDREGVRDLLFCSVEHYESEGEK